MTDEQEQGWQVISTHNDRHYTLIAGVDQVRVRFYDGHEGKWRDWSPWEIVKVSRTVGDWVGAGLSEEWQFRRRVAAAQPATEQPKAVATTDRGERYRRRIYQSIDGPDKGKSIIVDLADVFDAFDVPYMLGQAVKKSVLPGERGSKDRLKDLREAAWHIQRQIQIEEAKNQ